jgi:hypothetical protein
MKPEQQRIAIAETCGWKPAPRGRWKLNERVERFKPDYLNDLNAMHEAEKTLNRESGYHEIGGYGLYLVALEHNASATAAQRAEAFLRTLNLWN